WRDDPPRPPETLATDLRSVSLSYRGLDREGELTAWLREWPDPTQLPVQVRIEVEDERGGPWPPLVVSLLQGQGRREGVFGGRDRWRQGGAAVPLVMWRSGLLTALVGAFALSARSAHIQARVRSHGEVGGQAARAGLE